MNDLFPDETDDKKKRLLTAALEEFAERGYELASTNQIVKKADLSKGMLFYFFQNKKGLFLSLAERCLHLFFSYMEQHRDAISDDPFHRLLDINRFKLQLFTEQPLLYKISIALLIDRPASLHAEIKELEQRLTEGFGDFYRQGLDLSRMREGVAYEKVLMMNFEAVEALTKVHILQNRRLPDAGLDDLRRVYDDLAEYFDALKHGLYK